MSRFYILALLLAGGSCWAQTQTSGYLAEFAQKWDNATNYTIELAEMMPDSAYDFRPIADTRTFSEQMIHSLKNMNWLNTKFLGGPTATGDLSHETYTKEEVLQLARDYFAACARHIATLTPADLDVAVEGFFAGPMTKRQILTLMNDHLTHHRGQMIVYLRLQGIEPPNYRGW